MATRPLALLVPLALVCGCAASGRTRMIEGLVPADPAEVAMDGNLLRAAAERLDSERHHGIDSMLVVRRGRLVSEHYWNGYDAATLHDLRSVTKSITALLVGIALERGLLGDLHDPAMPYLAAAYPGLRADDDPPITLEDLLTMRSGLACDDRDRRSPGHEDRMVRARDWTRFFLTLPRTHKPGERTQYCTGGVVTLGRIVAEAAGRTIPDFADEHLFAPLGIHAHAWRHFDRGRQTDTGGHLHLRPRAMAKLGQLVLQRGVWDQGDIVSGAWIDAMTAVQTRMDADQQPYGYLWWRVQAKLRAQTIDLIYASGNGGQYIFIAPSLDLVAVFTGSNYNDPAAGRPFAILGEYILPAALGPAPPQRLAHSPTASSPAS
jgi:CubicO group peptidase (beta-lactamase class C family)